MSRPPRAIPDDGDSRVVAYTAEGGHPSSSGVPLSSLTSSVGTVYNAGPCDEPLLGLS